MDFFYLCVVCRAKELAANNEGLKEEIDKMKQTIEILRAEVEHLKVNIETKNINRLYHYSQPQSHI